MAELKARIGDRVGLKGDHPWAGHAGEVTGFLEAGEHAVGRSAGDRHYYSIRLDGQRGAECGATPEDFTVTCRGLAPREPGELGRRYLEDGRMLVLYPLVMGTVRLCVGPADAQGYDDAWCYQTPAEGMSALELWTGEGDAPDGWFRHIGSGRRRPDGDPAREYVRA